MNLLLDTCTFLWLTLEPDALSPKALEYIKNPENGLYLSSVTAWEIILKYKQGKLLLDDPPDEFVKDQRIAHFIEELSFGEADALHQARIGKHHKDPFDRMLVCQAIEHDFTLLTPDSKIRAYDVKTDW